MSAIEMGLWASGASALLLVPFFIVLGVVGWVGSERALRRGPPAELPRREDFDIPLEEVAFSSRDGTCLRGWFVAAASGRTADAPTVVLMHGYGSRKEEMLPHAAYLRRHGCNAFLFDFRFCGDSDGDAITFGMLEQHDVRGALDYLASRGDVDLSRVGFQAVSMGTIPALLVAAEEPRIAGIVAEAPFIDVPSVIGYSFQKFVRLPSFPWAPAVIFVAERRVGIRARDITTAEALRRFAGRPLLVIHDEHESAIPPESARVVFEAAWEPKRYWVAPGAKHALGWQSAPAQYEREVLAFWSGVLGTVGEAASPGPSAHSWTA